jgi:DNA invertase Pin-like site-specific DNA recombinase
MTESTLSRPRVVAALSSKILACHRERLAIVYVRQSSTRQVEENIESTQLQYQLADRAVLLGWPQERVEVIDDDLGVSGRSIEGRIGFQRLLAEVSLEHVGIVLGIEMSRLARSCRDWHQLLELCAVFGTLLGDADGVYEPRDHNDRLLLGLKGTMSEAELHVLQGRLRAGQLNKARRGEYFTHAPIGYIRTQDSLELEPDDQAREVVQQIFDQFRELGAMSAVMRYLAQNHLKIGVRSHRGPDKGLLQWHLPNQATVLGILHHPIYAGAYVYGRRESNPRKAIPGRPSTGRRWAAPDDWDVLIRDRLPAYITWEQWEKNQKKLRENSACYGIGAPRGSSLIAGRIVCARCGRHMSVSYATKSNARFTCDMSRQQWGVKQCQALNAKPLHDLVEQQLLLAVSPASIELSLTAARAIEADRFNIERHHRQSVERAAYNSDVARRRYESVDADNRLVAAELERRWESTLLAQRQAEESLHRLQQQQPSKFSPAEESQLRKLSEDIPALWRAETTTGVDRQTIFRALVTQVAVEVINNSERVRVTILWVGGFESHHEIRKSVQRFEQLESSAEIRSRLIELKRQGATYRVIADTLNREGYRSTSGTKYSVPTISGLCCRFRRDGINLAYIPASGNLWTLTTLAAELGIKRETLNTWRRRGWIEAEHKAQKWIFKADKSELKRLHKLANYQRSPLQKTPEKLTMPNNKKRSKGP